MRPGPRIRAQTGAGIFRLHVSQKCVNNARSRKCSERAPAAEWFLFLIRSEGIQAPQPQNSIQFRPRDLKMGYVEVLRRDGITAILARHHKWYRSRLMINNHNWEAGRADREPDQDRRAKVQGVDCAQIDTAHKSTLWFGLHELEERALLDRHLPCDLPLVELGGGLGVVACLSNRKLARPEQHIVVEALPSMAALLERNRDFERTVFGLSMPRCGMSLPRLKSVSHKALSATGSRTNQDRTSLSRRSPYVRLSTKRASTAAH